MKVRTFRHKYRFCTNLREEDLLFLRQSAGLSDDETVCLLIDDSLLMKGTKNVVFTDKRILWQEKRGAPYRQVLLSDLKGSSVFARQNGSNPVITILNGSMSVSLTFKNIRKHDSLRIIFHDYLSRYCAGYSPLDEENARRYEKEVLPRIKKRSALSFAFALAGGIFFLAFSLINISGELYRRSLGVKEFDVLQLLQQSMTALSLICWAVNIILPASKSKMMKAALLFVSTVYFVILLATSFPSRGNFGFGFVLVALFLLADRFDCARFEPALAGAAALFAVLIALVIFDFGSILASFM